MDASNRFDILIHVQPWHALLLEAEQIVDLAAGDLGASGLAISVKAAEACSAVTVARDGEFLAIRLASGVLYQPKAEQYASTRLRPHVSATLKGKSPLARIAETCRDRGLRFRLRLGALRDAALVTRQPDIGACNALSLPLRDHLCVGNPDVVELVRCELLDLADQFQPDGIELEDITGLDRFEPAAEGTALPTQPGPVESTLLAICFCTSCRQQAIHADIDAASAQRSVQVHLQRWFQKEEPHLGTIDNLLAEDPILAEYVARQRDALLAAVQLWLRAVPNVSLLLPRDRPLSPWNPSFEDLAAIAPRITLPPAQDERFDQQRQWDAAAGVSAKVEAGVDVASRGLVTGQDIVRYLDDLAHTDIAGIMVENGLSVSPARRPFIRQGIRAARRERNL